MKKIDERNITIVIIKINKGVIVFEYNNINPPFYQIDDYIMNPIKLKAIVQRSKMGQKDLKKNLYKIKI